MTNRSMELEVWDGDWGLPSVDMDCLQLMVYCQLSGAPVYVKFRNSPFQRALPTFRHGKVSLCKLQDVVSYLQTKNFYADHKLSSKNLSEIQAYSHLLKEKLFPALQFVWWVDKKNSMQLTRAWYAKKLWFPFNFYYPVHYEGQAKNYIAALYGSLEEDYESIETQVYSDAEKCLTLLSNRLGDSKFFFGNQPSSLDAIIYSYLAPLLKAPFPNPTLQNYLKACSNLVNFCVTITQKYFPGVSEDYQKQQEKENEKQLASEFPNKRNRFIAGLVAMVAMSLYALLTGFVEIDFVENENEENVKE